MMFFHFGCRNTGPGHYLTPAKGTPVTPLHEIPWGNKIDGGLLDKNKPQIQGKAIISHKDGWTAISFWDRSIDYRAGSNSAFIANSIETFDSMLEYANMHFPEIMKRFDFTIEI